MTQRTATSWTAGLCVAALVGACASNPSSTMGTPQSAPGNVISNAAGADLSVNVPALSSADIEFLGRMTNANILEHMTAGDSLEVAMSQLALARTQTPAVRDYANMLIGDHSMNLQHDMMVAQQTGLTMQMAAGDTSALHLFGMLQSLNDAASPQASDRTYLQTNVQMHQRMIAELQTLRSVATNNALRQHIDMTIPVMRKHLGRALALRQQLGFSQLNR